MNGNTGMFTHRRSFVAAVLLLLSGCDTAAEPPQPDPAALEIVSGDDQEFVVGAALPNPLVVRVTDLNGNPKQGALVKWTVTGYGSVSPDSSRTDAAGTAQTTWTLPTSAGAATVTATTGGASRAVFQATAHDRGTRLVFLVQPTSVEVGGTLNPALRVAVQNGAGFTDPIATGPITVTVAAGSGDARLSGTTTVTPVAGVASFPDLSVDRPASVRLFAAAEGVDSATSALFGVTFRVAMIAAGSGQTCAVAVSALAYCWGSNRSGQVGDSTTLRRFGPAPVVGRLQFNSVTKPTLDSQYSCGITVDRNAYCWGSFGGLAPVRINVGVTFAQLSAGFNHICGVTAESDVYCWGTGTTPDKISPARVNGNLKFASVSAADHFTCGVTTDQLAYCWGYNLHGMLGDGTTIDRTEPTPVKTSLRFLQVSAGFNSTCGITTEHAAYCWGLNSSGQVGDGSTERRLTPTAVSGNLWFNQISSGSGHACGVTIDSAAYCWGSGQNGELGDGTTEIRLQPTPVPGGLSFAHISAGHNHTCGLTTTSRAYCWGSNGDGGVGDGTGIRRLLPTPVGH